VCKDGAHSTKLAIPTPRRVGRELEALDVVVDATLASLVRVAVALVRRAWARKLQDHVILPLLVVPGLVGADGGHDRVEVEVARRDQLALVLHVDGHRRRRREQHVAGLDVNSGLPATSLFLGAHAELKSTAANGNYNRPLGTERN